MWARRLNSAAPRLPALWFMTDAARTDDPCAVVERLPESAGIIFRHYGSRDRVALGRRLRALAGRRGMPFLVAGDAKLAFRLRADGVHVPEPLLHRLAGVRRMQPGWIVTASAHSRAALIRAARGGADAIIVAPVLSRGSRSRALGRLKLAGLAHASPVPVYALGGITGENAHQLSASGIAGFAAVGAFLRNS